MKNLTFSKNLFKTIKICLFIYWLGFFWLNDAFALDPKRSITQYGHDVWNDEMPQSTVHSIVQTRDGYIWFGTYEGLVRFDGLEFISYNNRNTPQLKRPGIIVLHEDSNGALWVGMLEGGLAKLSNGIFTPYGTEKGLSNDNVRAIYEDKKGNLWIGTDNGLNLFKDGKFTIYNSSNGLANNSIRTIAEDNNGSLWIGTEGGLSLWQNGNFTSYTTQDGLPHNAIRKISPDKNGKLWLSTSLGLVLWNKGVEKIYSTEDGLSSNNIRAVFCDLEGNIWIGTDNGGLNRLFNGKIDHYQVKDGLSNDNVRYIFEDREGSLWVGTTSGLNRFRDSKFTNFTVADGLINDFVRTVLEDSNGNIWIGTDGGGLSLFSDNKFTNFTTKDGLVSDLIRSIVEDRDGNIWIGTNEGLSYWKDNKFTNYTTKEGLSHNSIYSLHQDKEGTIWIGTNGGGINLLKDGKISQFNKQQSLLNASVRAIFEDREGNLWFGTYTGLHMIQNGNLFTYTQKDGISGASVFSAYQDKDGDIWFTTNDGFTRLKNRRFIPYPSKTGLFEGLSFQILEDSKGYFWASTPKGIIRIKKSDFDDYDKKLIKSISYTLYGKIDGMKTNQCNGASQPCAIKSRDGRLWFATARGVTTINPDKIKINQRPPEVYLTKVVVDQDSITLDQAKIIPPGKNKLEFHYTGLSFLALEKVKFKFKLVGFDQDWVIADTRRVAYYTNLPPGDYIFQVIACNNDGIWNTQGTNLKFSVKPYPWRTPWAYTLYITTVLVLGYSMVRYRETMLKRRNQILEKKVNKRTEELNKKNNLLDEKVQELDSKNQELHLSKTQIEEQHQAIVLANKELARSQKETEQKNQLLEQANLSLAQKNEELMRSKEQLAESYKQAEKIFSAMTDILPGTILDEKYRLDSKIGSGGYGVIYKATHISMQRAVAVKVFRPSSGNASSQALERFRLEGISACRINHPNAVAVLDSNITASGIAYLVMELLQGHTLAQELETLKRIPIRRALEVMIPVCNVLAQAHESGIIHRDIKPDNIFIHKNTEGEIVKVVDFGIAKLAGDTFNMELSKLTGTGTLVGTPTYMSPERLSNKTYDGKSDIYSLGIVLYEIVSGYPPFESFDDNIWALINMHLADDPTPLSSILTDIPEVVDKAILKTLLKDPEERPSAQELSVELTQILSNLTI
ncbi:MAG: protein kinase [Acidobacteria bacterium]|nr:protein kinase [Acidobacteriota bacterium]